MEDREVTEQPPEKAAEEAGLQGRASVGKASSEGNVPRKGFDDDWTQVKGQCEGILKGFRRWGQDKSCWEHGACGFRAWGTSWVSRLDFCYLIQLDMVGIIANRECVFVGMVLPGVLWFWMILCFCSCGFLFLIYLSQPSSSGQLPVHSLATGILSWPLQCSHNTL